MHGLRKGPGARLDLASPCDAQSSTYGFVTATLIVLRAVSTVSGNPHVFCVHKSIFLSIHSEAFRAMFGGEDVLDASSEKYGGVPVVDLHDDAQGL